MPHLRTNGDRSILSYAFGTAFRHTVAKRGFILFNPLTKRDVVPRTYKIISPAVPSPARLTYEMVKAGIITETNVTQDTTEVAVTTTAEVNDNRNTILILYIVMTRVLSCTRLSMYWKRSSMLTAGRN